ncbi:MAG: oligosaccharide repeat unit polymerase [Gemmatimonadetes bacterium]|nr:oligosaccharide repeat unit polymerase [Gemmatimonadota bacterium]
MLLPYAVALLLGGLAVVGRVTGGNWLSPAAFFPSVWALLMLAAGALQGAFPLHAAGLWVIVSMVVAFQVGALLFPTSARGSANGRLEATVEPGAREAIAARLFRVTALATFPQLLGAIGVVWTAGVAFGIDLSLIGLLRLGNVFSVARYAGVDEVPTTIRLLSHWMFPAALLGGMLGAVTDAMPRRVVSAIPLFLALLSGFVVGARTGFLLSVVMWMSGFFAVKVCVSGGTYNPLRAGWILRVVALGFGLIAVSAVVQYLRGGFWRQFNFSVLAEIAVAAFFGSVSAFTTWVPVADLSSPALGAYTFAGPYDLLGLAPRIQGLYQGVVYFHSGSSSNIYTVFRGLMQDFGLVGAWGACLAVGALSSMAYRRCAAGRIQWAVALSAFYGAAMFSHLYSVFINNSVTMGWVIAAGVTLWPERGWTREVSPEPGLGSTRP